MKAGVQEYTSHQSMVLANPIIFIFLVCLIPIAGLGLIPLVLWFIITRTTKLDISNGKAIFTKGIISKDRTELSINSIRSVRITQGLWGRITGVGTVRIFTAGDIPEIVASGMPNIQRVRQALNNSNVQTGTQGLT